MIKRILIGLATTIILLIALAYWAYNLIDRSSFNKDIKHTQKSSLSYLTEDVPAHRGKILAVVTSHTQLGNTDKKVGHELTELSRAYYVFEANGFSVDIASPQGGEPPMIKDGDDMNTFDHAFLNDEDVKAKLKNTYKLSDIDSNDYQAIYYVGGKGTMFDFIDNPDVTQLTEQFYQNGKVIAAVCHGPAALIGAKNAQGEYILANKAITSFTNEEELLLIPDAKQIFPFLLQDKITEQGGKFSQGDMYLDNIAIDGQIITGQNPWSVWSMAEATIKQLGYTPKVRELTPEERAVDILKTYHQSGTESALAKAQTLLDNQQTYMRNLVFMHAILGFMKFDILDGIGTLIFVQRLKNPAPQNK